MPFIMRLERPDLDMYYACDNTGSACLMGFMKGDETLLLRGAGFLKKERSNAIHSYSSSPPSVIGPRH